MPHGALISSFLQSSILLSFLLKQNQLFLAFIEEAAAETSETKMFMKLLKISTKTKLEFYISFSYNNNKNINVFSFHFGISFMQQVANEPFKFPFMSQCSVACSQSQMTCQSGNQFTLLSVERLNENIIRDRPCCSTLNRRCTIAQKRHRFQQNPYCNHRQHR